MVPNSVYVISLLYVGHIRWRIFCHGIRSVWHFHFLSACGRKRVLFPRNRSRERKSVHRQWSVVCQSLRLRLSSSVGVGLRIFRSPVCNITLVPDPNPRNMHINGFQKRVYPGLPLNRRAIVPCPLPIPAAMPVLVESMQSAYGQRRRFLYPAECRSRRCVLLLTE